MSFERFIAFRYLRKRSMSRFLSFMSAVAIGSVAIGTAALIIALIILDGFERELQTNLIGLSSHIQVQMFRDDMVRDTDEGIETLRRIPDVASVSRYYESEAMAITRDDIEGVRIKGVLPSEDVSSLRGKIVAGEYQLAPVNGKASVVIGKRLADKLNLVVGDRVVFLGVTNLEAAYRAPKVQCVIRGLYETGMAEYIDDIYVFTALTTSQNVFGSQGYVSGYDVRTTNPERIDDVVNRIREDIGYPLDPRSVYSIYRNLFVWIDLQQELVPIVVGSLIVISVFNIIATLLLFVIEKTRYIGTLIALGATKASVRRIFMLQGVLIGVVGAGIGAFIALAFGLAQQELRFFSLPQDVYFMTTVPIHLDPLVFLGVSALAVLITFVSSFIPAWLAARLNPITSIRFH